MPRLFISLPCLDTWIEKGQATLGEDRLTTMDGATYRLGPGVFFTAMAGGEPDPHQLLGRVKSQAQLEEMGAEHYEGSVIMGEVAYQVVEGFLGVRVI
jgi:hypothetical protein